MTTKDLNKKHKGLKSSLGFIPDSVLILDTLKIKNNKQQFKEQQNILETATRNADIGITLITRDYKIFWANKAFRKTYGNNLYNKKCYTQIYNRKKICLECPVKKVFEGAKSASKEIAGIDEEGLPCIFELAVTPVRNKKGEVFAALEVATPKTSRKQMEKKIKDTESLYHALFEQTPLGVLVLDPKTSDIVEFNTTAHRQLGYTKEEFAKLKIADLTVDHDQIEIKKRINRTLDEGQTEFLINVRAKNGKSKLILVNQRKIELSGKELLLVTCHDVTGINRMHDALKVSEERFNGIAGSVKDALILVNSEANITYWNPAAQSTFGYTDKEAIGKSIHELVVPKSMPKEVRTRIDEGIKAFSETGIGYFTVGNVEVRGQRKDGSEFPAELSISPMRAGGKWNAVGVVKDITKRKTANQKLWDAEQKYHTLFNQAPLGVMIIDPKTATYAEFNDIAHLQLGYTREEFEKIKIYDIQSEESPEQVNAHIKEIIEKGGGEFETKHRTKTGEIRTVIVTNKPFKIHGKPYLHCIAHDITESKKIQNALVSSEANYRQLAEDLKSSEEKFRAISTSAMDAIILSDQHNRVLYVNPAAEKMYGYTPEEVIGKELADFIIPNEGKEKPTKLLHGLKESRISKREFGVTAIRKDGTKFPVDLSIVSLKIKKKNCLLAIIKDITDWKSMEEALRQERDLLESVTTSTDMILAIINRNYQIIWANQTAKEKIGCQNIENTVCYQTFGNNSPVVCEGCGVKRVFENGKSIVRRDYLNTVNGSEAWLELISTPIKDKNGEVIAALEIAIDINERKQLQNKLAGYSQKLEEIVLKRTEELKKTQAELVKSERLAAIGELAGMIGHDLRNPLTGIKNSAYFMKKKGDQLQPVQAHEMLEVIDKCVDYSNRIINDLLDYSREIHLTLEQHQLQKILQDSLSIINIPENVVIQNILEERLRANVDGDKIKRVFINLIKNAIDAMQNGGVLTFKSKDMGNCIEISFNDTGVGINEDILPKLFTPLVTTKAQGMGFGLAICKRIIEAHKGTIAVKSIKGQGTTFKITIPTDLKNEVGGETHG